MSGPPLLGPDLGPAPINDPPQGLGKEAAAPERIRPKMGLGAMALFVQNLRLRARMSDGAPAARAWLLLEPADVEALGDIADTLDWLLITRAAEKQRGRGR